MLKRERGHWVLCLRVFVCFLKAGVLGEVSGEDLNRIFISFPGVSFNTLMPQNECVGHVPVSFPFKECHWRGTRREAGVPGTVWNV